MPLLDLVILALMGIAIGLALWQAASLVLDLGAALLCRFRRLR